MPQEVGCNATLAMGVLVMLKIHAHICLKLFAETGQLAYRDVEDRCVLL
jgi:hypothetical protein